MGGRLGGGDLCFGAVCVAETLRAFAGFSLSHVSILTIATRLYMPSRGLSREIHLYPFSSRFQS
jgi:hypothetical protein